MACRPDAHAFVLAALILVSLVVRYMLILDRQMIYFPERGLAATPDSVGLAYEDVYLSSRRRDTDTRVAHTRAL